MPQMAPMNWMLLYLLMIMIFLMMASLNYFSFMYTNTNIMKKTHYKKNNWKW